MIRSEGTFMDGQRPTEPMETAPENALRALRRKLAPELVAAAHKGETALAPAVLHERSSFYVNPHRFAQEQERLFRKMPLVARLSADLAGPGSYRTFDDTGIPQSEAHKAEIDRAYAISRAALITKTIPWRPKLMLAWCRFPLRRRFRSADRKSVSRTFITTSMT